MRISLLTLLAVLGCGPDAAGGPTTVTVSGCVLGAEGRILRRQLERFDRETPDLPATSTGEVAAKPTASSHIP